MGRAVIRVSPIVIEQEMVNKWNPLRVMVLPPDIEVIAATDNRFEDYCNVQRPRATVIKVLCESREFPECEPEKEYVVMCHTLPTLEQYNQACWLLRFGQLFSRGYREEDSVRFS